MLRDKPPGGLRSQRDSSLGHRVRYAYDRAGDLSTVTLGLSEPFSKLPIPAAQRPDWVMQITRTQGGEELARAFPGGIRALWKRDDKGRLEERRVLTGVREASDPRGASSGADVLRTQYAWRSSEQIASLSNLLSGDRVDYEHDARGHLIRETRHKRSPQGAWQSEVVPRLSDQVGNLFRQPDFKDAAYGKNGQLLRWGQNTYAYDEHGRLALKTLADGARWLYRWSPAGRLLEVERPDGKVVAFEYDTFGRRTQKRFDGEVTTYIWDGDHLVHQHKRLADGSQARLASWVFEPGTFAALARIEGSRRYAVVCDHLGVPRLVTDETGKVAWKAQLDTYGVPRDEVVADVDQPLRFPGQLFDPETGLFYNRRRYYDCEAGRYLQADPVGLRGGLSLYAYVHDPQMWVDPYGLTGAYLFGFETGEVYVGKGPVNRFNRSVARKARELGSKVTAAAHLDFGSNKMGLMVEYKMMEQLGYGTPLGSDLLNEKWDAGKKLFQNAPDAQKKAVMTNVDKLFDLAGSQNPRSQLTAARKPLCK